jgi:L,D-transpeptidase catalytic domain/Sporulation and spore germination/Putative peptidoglycan binding domain
MSCVRLVAVALVAAFALAFAAPGGAAVRVWFAKGTTLAPVERPASGVRPAVDALLAGPTPAERASGFRSLLPRGVLLREVRVAKGIVTLDLAALAVGSRDVETIRARVRQLVLTAGGVSGVRGVQVLVEGGRPLGIVPGLDLSRPVTAADAAPKGANPATIRRLQEQLVDLGFMSAGGISGEADDRTRVAVTAFQKWARLDRTGVLDGPTTSRLLLAARPEPIHRVPGRKVEVLLDRQLALVEENGKVLRTVHISSGQPGYSTPAGSFSVYRKERMSWSIPYSVWMPWASYFTGGIAFHQSASVPTYPASHGCVRVNAYDAPLVYEFAVHGTPVEVMWRS